MNRNSNTYIRQYKNIQHTITFKQLITQTTLFAESTDKLMQLIEVFFRN